jgi:uncharacterized glyoxalase superfamily protein PhnB
MSTTTIPAGYQQVMPYVIVPDPSSLLQFMKEVLGATVRTMQTKDDGSLGHAEVQVGESVIMFSGSTEDWEAAPAGLFVYVGDADAAMAKALELGATQVMPVSDQGYGRSGGVKDANGCTWWLTSAAGQ